MIDRRDVSYTEGDPLNPIVSGVGFKPQTSSIDVSPGVTISTKRDVPGQPVGQTEAQIEADKIKPIAPVKWGMPGLSGGIGLGMQPFFGWDMLKMAFGSAEQMQETGQGYLAGTLGAIEPLGLIPEGTTDELLDIPRVDFPGSKTPLLPLLDVAIPGSGDWISNVFYSGNGGGGSSIFPDLSGIPKYLLYGLLGIGAIYLGGKYLGRK